MQMIQRILGKKLSEREQMTKDYAAILWRMDNPKSDDEQRLDEIITALGYSPEKVQKDVEIVADAAMIQAEQAKLPQYEAEERKLEADLDRQNEVIRTETAKRNAIGGQRTKVLSQIGEIINTYKWRLAEHKTKYPHLFVS